MGYESHLAKPMAHDVRLPSITAIAECRVPRCLTKTHPPQIWEGEKYEQLLFSVETPAVSRVRERVARRHARGPSRRDLIASKQGVGR
jgi:hypothetical protein